MQCRRPAALDAIDTRETRLRDDAVVAGRVLHQPIARIASKHIAARGALDAERGAHSLGEHGNRAITVTPRAALRGGRLRRIFRIESIAGHAPAIAGRAGQQGIARRITVEPDRALERTRRGGELHRHDLVLHCPASGGVRGEIGIFKFKGHARMLSHQRLRRFLRGATVERVI